VEKLFSLALPLWPASLLRASAPRRRRATLRSTFIWGIHLVIIITVTAMVIRGGIILSDTSAATLAAITPGLIATGTTVIHRSGVTAHTDRATRVGIEGVAALAGPWPVATGAAVTAQRRVCDDTRLQRQPAALSSTGSPTVDTAAGCAVVARAVPCVTRVRVYARDGRP
jgi:hypothetical protein